MVKFLVRFKSFVDKYKLWFFIIIGVLITIALCTPYSNLYAISSGEIVTHPPNYHFLQRSLFARSFYALFRQPFVAVELKNIGLESSVIAQSIVSGISISLLIVVSILFAIIFTIVMFIKKQLFATAFLPVFLTVLIIDAATFPGAGYKLVPHVAFYLLFALTLFEVLYYTAWIVSKRHPNGVPPKTPKTKLPTDRERIDALEREIAELKASKKDGNK